MSLDDLSTKEFEKRVDKDSVVILPLGVIEEHGDHLPLSTDSLQSEYIAEEVAKRTGALVAPPIRYGVCNTTKNFPGTISIEFDTLRCLVQDVLFELARNGFKNIVVISGHAGSSHLAAVRLAAKEVVDEVDVKVLALSDYEIIYEAGLAEKGEGHSGWIETSRVMAICPDLIKGKGRKGINKIPRYVVLRHPEKYWTGVSGDPTKATEEEGRKMNELVVGEIVKMVNKMLTMEV